jgi:hypothetical protein
MGCNAKVMGVGEGTDGAVDNASGCVVVWCTFSVGSDRLSRERRALAYVRRRGMRYQVVDIQWMCAMCRQETAGNFVMCKVCWNIHMHT